MVEAGESINAILWLIVAGISLIPLYIFFLSYIRVKSKKLLITTVAFGFFFVKAITLGMRLFIPEPADEIWYMDEEFWWSVAAILDIIIIGLIAYALKKKS